MRSLLAPTQRVNVLRIKRHLLYNLELVGDKILAQQVLPQLPHCFLRFERGELREANFLDDFVARVIVHLTGRLADVI